MDHALYSEHENFRKYIYGDHKDTSLRICIKLKEWPFDLILGWGSLTTNDDNYRLDLKECPPELNKRSKSSSEKGAYYVSINSAAKLKRYPHFFLFSHSACPMLLPLTTTFTGH